MALVEVAGRGWAGANRNAQADDGAGPPEKLWTEPHPPNAENHIAGADTLVFRIHNADAVAHVGTAHVLYENGDGLTGAWSIGEHEVPALSTLELSIPMGPSVDALAKSGFAGSAVFVFAEDGMNHRTSGAIYFHWSDELDALLVYDRAALETEFHAGDIAGSLPLGSLSGTVDVEGSTEQVHVVSISGSSDVTTVPGLHRYDILEGEQ